MVPRHNLDQVKELSRFDNDFSGMSPGQQLIAFLERLNRNQEEIIHFFKESQVDVDIHGNEQGNTGIVDLTNQWRGPFKITDVIASWNAGQQTTTVQPNPTAGTNFTYTNTTGTPQQLNSFSSLFTADATVANRFLSYNITDAAGDVLASDANGTAVVASTTLNFRGYIGATHLNSGSGAAIMVLPQNVVIPPGGHFLLNGVSGAADTWTNIALTFGVLIESVTIQIDDRLIYPNGQSGEYIINNSSAMQIPDQHRTIKLTVVPPVACHLSILGSSDYRKIDRL